MSRVIERVMELSIFVSHRARLTVIQERQQSLLNQGTPKGPPPESQKPQSDKLQSLVGSDNYLGVTVPATQPLTSARAYVSDSAHFDLLLDRIVGVEKQLRTLNETAAVAFRTAPFAEIALLRKQIEASIANGCLFMGAFCELGPHGEMDWKASVYMSDERTYTVSGHPTEVGALTHLLSVLRDGNASG